MRALDANRLFLALALSLAATSAAVSSVSAYDLSTVETASGVWRLSREDGARMCQIRLRTDGDGGAHALGMPAGCRHAMPALNDVAGWRLDSPGRIDLVSRNGAAVLSFEARASGLAAAGPAGETYVLIAANEGAPGMRRAAPRAAAAAPAQSTPAVHASELPGRYSILRDGNKDTGCMLTLETSPRGAGSRAQLAPACRDNGIVVFDPMSWAYVGGKLKLTARKGHSAMFERAPDGTWQKDPKEGGKPLGFRKM